MGLADEEVITRFAADDDYSSAVMKQARQTRLLGTAIDAVQGKLKRGGLTQGMTGDLDGAGSKLGQVSSSLGNMGVIIDTILGPIKAVGFAITATAGAAAAGTAAFAGFASKALDAYAEVDSLQRGLTTMTGSVEEAVRQYERLQQVAKLPGLGDVTDVVTGTLNLQAVGFDAQFAERALIEVGNALAVVGKGQAELDGVTMALTQIASKGVVSAEEINQLAERLPQIRRLMTDAFGTSNTEAIQKMGIASEEFIRRLITQMGKLERATPSIRNSMDNLAAASKAGWADAGKAIAQNYMPAIEKAATMIENMASSGAFKSIADEWSKIFGGGNEDFFVTTASYVFAVGQALPSMIESAVKTAKEGMIWIYDKVKAMVQFAAKVSGQGPLIDQLIESVEKAFSSERDPMSPLGMFLNQIEKSAQEFRDMANSNSGQRSGILGVIQTAMEGQNKPLMNIETNTRATAESLSRAEQIYQRVLGGTGRSPLSRVEMAANRGRGRNKVENLIRMLAAAVYEQNGNAAMGIQISQSGILKF